MSHKTVVKVAIVMLVVFGVITIVYPQIFSPEPQLPPGSIEVPAAVPAVPADQK